MYICVFMFDVYIHGIWCEYTYVNIFDVSMHDVRYINMFKKKSFKKYTNQLNHLYTCMICLTLESIPQLLSSC